MIAIPNTEKPKSCYNHCLEDFIANEEIGCPLKNYEESHQYKNRIHPDCPLIEIVVDETTRKVLKECNRIEADANCYGTDWAEVVLTGERRTNE